MTFDDFENFEVPEREIYVFHRKSKEKIVLIEGDYFKKVGRGLIEVKERQTYYIILSEAIERIEKYKLSKAYIPTFPSTN